MTLIIQAGGHGDAIAPEQDIVAPTGSNFLLGHACGLRPARVLSVALALFGPQATVAQSLCCRAAKPFAAATRVLACKLGQVRDQGGG